MHAAIHSQGLAFSRTRRQLYRGPEWRMFVVRVMGSILPTHFRSAAAMLSTIVSNTINTIICMQGLSSVWPTTTRCTKFALHESGSRLSNTYYSSAMLCFWKSLQSETVWYSIRLKRQFVLIVVLGLNVCVLNFSYTMSILCPSPYMDRHCIMQTLRMLVSMR